MSQIRSPGNQPEYFLLAHSAATTAKVPIVIGGMVVIPLNTAAANELNQFYYDCQISGFAKETGQAWAVGDWFYLDATNSRFTKTSSGNTLAGKALAAAASGDTVIPLSKLRSA